MRRLNRGALAFVAALTLMLTACSDSSPGGGSSDSCTSDDDCPEGTCVAGTCEGGGDVGDDPDTGGEIDTGADSDVATLDMGNPDTEPDVTETDADTTECVGEFGCPCERNAECESGFCIDTRAGRVCTARCIEECDFEDWECRLIEGTGGDLVEICVPNQEVLCNPCEADIDCGGLADLCLPLSDGEFCGQSCDDSSECPEGYECDDFVIEDEMVSQCVPTLGFCGDCLDVDGDGYGLGGGCSGLDCDDLEPSIYEGASEICDGFDNDCDDGIDEDFDLTTDPSNCGFCGTECGADNAATVCADASCVIDACADGYWDVNGDYADGCEYACTLNADSEGAELCNGLDDDCDGALDEDFDTATDTDNCGECGFVCDLGGAATICVEGMCRIGECEDGFADCNGLVEDGCEVNVVAPDSLRNCGECGNECSATNGTPTCDAGTCAIAMCGLGYDDCDMDAANGCETDLTTNIGNCGECGTTCSYDNATATCEGGSCVLDECLPGYGDCDMDPTNGCEVNLVDSLDHCGACGDTCDPDNSTAMCTDGVCGITECAEGYDDCDGFVDNGCEVNLTEDVENCGVCDTLCVADGGDPACVGGVCGVGACDAGFADCDGDPTNGCEVNLSESARHCGTCNNACSYDNGTGICIEGECALGGCAEGFGNCDGDPMNGCEQDTLESLTHCGACNSACAFANGDGVCDEGVCMFEECRYPFDDCNADLIDGCEVDLRFDVDHCGTCGTECPDTGGEPVCSFFACGINTCDDGRADCNGLPGDGCEIFTGSDVNHCGGCGNVCAFDNAADLCIDGACTLGTCNPGFGDCNGDPADGCETNLTTSLDHCGTCDAACLPSNANGMCTGGSCGISSCQPGFRDCNMQASDGCEVNIRNETLNCGGCGDACTVNNGEPVCTAGICEIATCDTGFDDCNNNLGDGCEVNLLESLSHCGLCGNDCDYANGVGACTGGACELVACDPGYADCNADPSDGCEVNLLDDEANCGSCAALCDPANSTAQCNTGVCEILFCALGFDDCNNAVGDGCEIDIRNNVANCGACGDVCTVNNGDPLCVGGSCSVGMCDPGFNDCNGLPGDGCEINMNVDLNNCGMCGNRCSYTDGIAACDAGTCELAGCRDGFRDCNMDTTDGCEINVQNDELNCGACNALCDPNNANGSCSAGACSIDSCAFGYDDCNGQVGDGCEIDLRNDRLNCGMCGDVCDVNNGTPECTGGACDIASCDDGFDDCNNNRSDGCEINLNTDESSCGMCGTTCSYANGTGVCNLGTCELAGCAPGWDDCDGNPSNGCETNLNTSETHCGGCGDVCAPANADGFCDMGTCTIDRCLDDYEDCNMQVSDGCEIDTATNVNFCGSCTNACAVNNGDPVCAAGSCGIADCDPGFDDCDGSYANGCEIDLLTNDNFCGTCGTNCTTTYANGNGNCNAGVCELVGCQDDFGNCDGNAGNGCETNLLGSLSHCGGCGNLCAPNNSSYDCNLGTCEILSCNSGFEDCDGNLSNGCEVNTNTEVDNCGGCGADAQPADPMYICPSGSGTPLCTSGVCGISDCDPGLADCDANPTDCETNILTEIDNCGGCDISCSYDNGTGICSTGVCELLECDDGWDDCNGDPSDGCETNLNESEVHCGTCNAACAPANGVGLCDMGTCTIDSCNTGFDDCSGGVGDGCETNLQTDELNCGTCDLVCTVANGGPECISGTCEVAMCTAPFDDCDGNYMTGCEANTNNDEANCGDCGTICSYPNATPICSTGDCSMGSCDTNFEDCVNGDADGCETDTRTSYANCGGCGNSCDRFQATTFCGGSTCQLTSCVGTYRNCDMDLSDGCEINVAGDVNNCGTCGNVCNITNANEGCSGGSCTIASCIDPFRNCDGDIMNGCERNTETSVQHCGGCNNQCVLTNASPRCNTGTCEIDMCNMGWGDCDTNDSNGCEADLLFDVDHCGGCGPAFECDLANAVPRCNTGSCEVQSCMGAYRDCDGADENGCERDTFSNLAHCGGCFMDCDFFGATETCEMGTCTFGMCESNYWDLDGNTGNGCEYFCTGTAGATDNPDGSFVDSNCDGIDGDISRSIFVDSELGSNGNAGTTPDAPVLTIAHALTLTGSARPNILVASTSYSGGTLFWRNGINMYGGYSNEFRTRDNSRATYTSTASVALSITNMTSSVTIDRTNFSTPNQSVSSRETRTIVVNGSGSNVTIQNSTITAGRGGPGVNGTQGNVGGSGSAGANGGDPTGGSGGSIGGGNGATGRNRASGPAGETGDDNGNASNCGGAGGAGSGTGGLGCGDGNPRDGGNGGNGCTGNAGSSGARGDNVGGFSGVDWSPDFGSPGGRGNAGGGGGGGGAGGGENCRVFGICTYCDTGRGGGGGGGGGSGGFGGTGAGGGGASIGIVVRSSTLTLISAQVTTVGGGAGGVSGSGGSGGSGGGGGAGNSTSADTAGDGGDGGNGGRGGNGGCGGSGSGGPSIGIWGAGSAVVDVTSVSFTIGSGGAGGNGCGNDGIGGVTGNTRSITVQ